MEDKLQEIINFFEQSEGYDKSEVITDILGEMKELKGYESDEIGLLWDNEQLMVLQEFTEEFYNKLIEKVINVVKSFK